MKKLTNEYQMRFKKTVLAVSIATILSAGVANAAGLTADSAPSDITIPSDYTWITAKSGGIITLDADVTVVLDTQKAVSVRDYGSQINVNNKLDIDATDLQTFGIHAQDSGQFIMDPAGRLTINSKGYKHGYSYGVWALSGAYVDLGTNAKITVNDASDTANNASAIYARQSSTTADLIVKAKDIDIEVNAYRETVVTADTVTNKTGKDVLISFAGVNNKITHRTVAPITMTAPDGSSALAAVSDSSPTAVAKATIRIGDKASGQKGTIDISSDTEGAGAYASGKTALISFYGDGNKITMTGKNANALYAGYGGTITMEGDSYQLITSGDGASTIAISATSPSSTASSIIITGNSANNRIIATGQNAHAISMSEYEGSSLTLNQTGGVISSAHGDVLRSLGGKADINLDGVTVTAGDNGKLINATESRSNSAYGIKSVVNLTAKNGSVLTGDVAGRTSGMLGVGGQDIRNLNADLIVNVESNSTWTGNADLANINLRTGGQWTGNAVDSSVYVGSGSVWTGASSFNKDLSKINQSLRNVNIDTGGTWKINNDSTVNNLTHAGTIAFAVPTTRALGGFNTLTVAGNYVGNGGTFMINTQLGNDTSLTDQLVVLGNASGNANIAINNAGGAGGVITNAGIRLVSIAGTSTASFNLVNPVSVGIYQYGHLNQATDGNWYLSTRSGTGQSWGNDTTDYESIRSGYSSYLNNMTVATNMFLQSHQTRVDAQGIRGDHGVRSWAYISGNKTKHNMMKGSTEASNSGFVLRMGSDYGFNLGGDSQLVVGLMAGYGHTDADVRAKRLTFNGVKDKTSTDIDGYNVGLYGTWYGQNGEGVGPYVDAWFQYNWFNNEIDNRYYGKNKYDSKAWNASLEAGYAFKVYNSDSFSLHVEPQAQVIYSNYSADSVTDMGVRVSNYDANGVIARLGTRVYAKANNIKPFAELNWWHDGTAGASADFRTNQGVKYNLSDDAPKNRFEVKAGVVGQINKNLSLQADIGMQMGKSSYRSYKGQLSVSYAW